MFGTRTCQANVLRSGVSGECQSGCLLLGLLHLKKKEFYSLFVLVSVNDETEVTVAG